VYGSFALTVGFGRWCGTGHGANHWGWDRLQRRCFSLSLHFGVWVWGVVPRTVGGLVDCYAAGIRSFVYTCWVTPCMLLGCSRVGDGGETLPGACEPFLAGCGGETIDQ